MYTEGKVGSCDNIFSYVYVHTIHEVKKIKNSCIKYIGSINGLGKASYLKKLCIEKQIAARGYMEYTVPENTMWIFKPVIYKILKQLQG